MYMGLRIWDMQKFRLKSKKIRRISRFKIFALIYSFIEIESSSIFDCLTNHVFQLRLFFEGPIRKDIGGKKTTQMMTKISVFDMEEESKSFGSISTNL